MTEPDAPSPAPDAAPGQPSSGDPQTGEAAPRVSTFSLEGRRAPALYVVGWIGTVMGLAVLLVSFLAAGSAAAPWLFLAGLVVLGFGLLAAAGSQAIERAVRSDLAYRGPSPVLAFLAVIVVTLVVLVIVLVPLAELGLDPGSPAGTTLALLITALADVGVVRLLVVGPGALSWADMGLRVKSSTAVRDLLTGALFALPVLAVTIVLASLLGRFLEPAPFQLPKAVDAVGLAANLVSAMVIAPVGEELFFRGFATTAWARAIGTGPAIVRGAVFFAIAHVLTLSDATFAAGAQRALFSFVALLPVGLALGWLFLARRSLYASIGMHAAFNGIQVLIVMLAGSSLAQ